LLTVGFSLFSVLHTYRAEELNVRLSNIHCEKNGEIILGNRLARYPYLNISATLQLRWNHSFVDIEDGRGSRRIG
jgi:hypothetical protein